jgi:hypothetical protein
MAFVFIRATDFESHAVGRSAFLLGLTMVNFVIGEMDDIYEIQSLY